MMTALPPEIESTSDKYNGFWAGGGEMGALMRAKDWSTTPVGPVETWPQSLKTAIGILLNSPYPMQIWWDKALTYFYNDAYVPVLGAKHPTALGQSAREVWAEIWTQMAPRIDQVMNQNKATFDEAMLMLLERYGYAEEVYYTFSFSPIRNDQGGVGGIFNACNDQTQQIVGERRLALLRELAAKTANARTLDEACTISATCLQTDAQDLPFAMIYLLEPEGKRLRLAGTFNINSDHPGCPDRVELGSDTVWPFRDVVADGQLRLIEDLSSTFGALPMGPWDRPPSQAVIMSTLQPHQTGQTALVIAGLNPYRPFNSDYRRFLELVNAQVASNIANAKAHEEERKRAEALAEIDQAKTLFFSNISHEFRTPLTLMLGPIEEALDDVNTLPENRIRMEVAHRNALRLLKLVNTLLDFSRIEAGRVQASYQPIDLAVFTAELVSMFRSATEKAGLNLIVDCAQLPESVYIDTDMWEKIVLNLLSNAFKHTFEGEIEVRLKWMTDHVDLVIRDTGVGIPAEQLPKLFERFYRVPNARSRTHEGSGIGLALVQELVNLHGGQIWVDSVLDRGTTFTVSVPTGKNHLPAERIEATPNLAQSALGVKPFVQEALRWLPAEEEEIERDVSGNEASEIKDLVGKGRIRVLLADDNRDMRDYVYRLLTPYYDVEAVSDGEAALMAARREPPDLILSDIMMPKMDGLEFLQGLRADESLRTIPVILLSARAGEEARIEGLQAGADGYLTKPFNARELLARIKTNLDLARVRREELIQKLEQQIKERTFQLEAANKELEAFAYSVSHDLRAPLRTIDGFSQMVLEEHSHQLDEAGQQLLQSVRQGSQKMGELIEAMLRFSKLSREQLNIEAGVNLSRMAQEMAHELQSQEPGRTVIFDIEPELVVTGDRRLLQSVLQNLLGNAYKYTAKHSTAYIQFGKTHKDEIPVYFVKDDGAGFDMVYASKLFGVFQRLHHEREFSGTGIGLASAARIIQRHGGQIWAEGEVEKGATFYFTLEPILLNPENGHIKAL